MIGRLDHVAIAVPDLAAAVARWRDLLGAEVGEARDLPDHGVRVAFARLPNSTVELMEPLGEGGPLSRFLARAPAGGLHHVCFEVADVAAEAARLAAAGAVPLGEPKVGAHGRPVVFLRPRDLHGTLVELLEAPGAGVMSAAEGDRA